MAQNVFINVTVDPSSATKTENYHTHQVSGSSTANSGDATFAYDSAKVTSLAIFESVIKTVRQRAIAGGLK